MEKILKIASVPGGVIFAPLFLLETDLLISGFDTLPGSIPFLIEL